MSVPGPLRWWRRAGWRGLDNLLPDWLKARLEVYRPALDLLDRQITADRATSAAAAEEELLRGVLALTSGSPFANPPLFPSASPEGKELTRQSASHRTA